MGNYGNMSTQLHSLYSGPTVLKFIFFVLLFMVLIMMLVIRKETSLDIIPIQSHAEVKNNTPNQLYYRHTSFTNATSLPSVSYHVILDFVKL